MEDNNQWCLYDHDPLLLTDVSLQQESSSYTHSPNSLSQASLSSRSLAMADEPVSRGDSPSIGFSQENGRFEGNSVKFDDPNVKNVFDGRSILGYSLTSPDLVICGSPDIAGISYGDSPELSKNKHSKDVEQSMELSLENGIKGSQVEVDNGHKIPTVKFSNFCQTFEQEEKPLSPEASFELLPPLVTRNESPQDHPPRDTEMLEDIGVSQEAEMESSEDTEDIGMEEKFKRLKREFDCQRKELTETRRELGEIKRENQQKSRECQEAWNSLKELQNELMRKSMHVGSLAFAIEGQVKEKSKWFSSLRDLTRKLKIMKMEHIKLLEEAEASKKYQADMREMGLIIKSKINEQLESHEDLKSKYIEGAKERKDLYNKVLELTGNIRVFCRCRPLNAEEISAGATMALDFEFAKDGDLTVMSNGAPKRNFKFDAVFGPQAEQADIFEDTAPFATSVLDGYNVCIFAYGQTGTGKTFTMEGTEEARGVNFRTLEKMFDIIKERQKLYCYDISVSVLEVYNEQIRDLLVAGNHPGTAAKRLEIRQAGEGMHHIPGLVEAHVNNMTEVWEVLQTGSNARAVSSTNANEHSSRSHCIHCVMVKGENLLNGECTRSKLWLVDLAGSERVAKTEVHGDRLKETQNINRSLSALGDVISALATKSSHIPFRNSKLTHLLQDSLGGDSKALMFVQISPNENDLSETICSLNFASRVRGIELGPARKQLDTVELLRHKQMAEKVKQEVRLKDLQIKKMEETIHGLESKMKESDNKNKNLQEKVKELESQLLVERKLARQHVDSKIAEQHQMKHQEEQNNTLMRPALASRPLGSLKNFNDPVSGGGWCKDQQINSAKPLAENNILKPCIPFSTMESSIKCIDHAEKENNPDMADKALLPKRPGRASTICMMTPRVPSAIASRRNSLIPLPSIPSLTQFQSPLLPKLTNQADQKDVNGELETNCVPAQTHCESPKEVRIGVKRIGSILRRSLHKKIQMKSPLQQHMRKVGVNVGMEKVRVSIGSRGRLAPRGQVGSGRRGGGAKDIQQKNSQKESFNKISTAKCLGQLAANYNTLQAINLDGNPAQKNVGDEQMKKYLQGLLPHLVYYNRQPMKVNSLKDGAERSVRLGMNSHQFDRSLRADRKTTRKGSQGVAATRRPSTASTHARRSVDSPKLSKGKQTLLPPTRTKVSTQSRYHFDSPSKVLNLVSERSMRKSRSEGNFGVL